MLCRALRPPPCWSVSRAADCWAEGQTPGRTTNQGLKITGKIMLAVCSSSVHASAQIVLVGSDFKPLALSPSPSHVKLGKGTQKNPRSVIEKSRGRSSRCCGLPSHTSGLGGGWAMGWPPVNSLCWVTETSEQNFLGDAMPHLAWKGLHTQRALRYDIRGLCLCQNTLVC